MKPIIPPAKFTTDLAASDESATSRVAIDDIVVLDNLNLRVEGTEDYKAGIAELAAKIEANGFYPDKPLAGYLRQDNKIVLTDGHRRLAAARLLNENSLDGVVIADLPVVVSPGTIDDVTIKMIASSEGRELSMFEKGLGVKRLIANGVTKDDIAKRLGVSVKTIDNYLIVANAPAKARDLLLADKVTSTQVLRTKGDADKLAAMVKKATDAGRTRARPSDAAPVKRAEHTPNAPIVDNPEAVKAALDGSANGAIDTLSRGEYSFAGPDHSFDVAIAKGATMGAVLRDIAAEIRQRVPHDQGDDDFALVDGAVIVSVMLKQPEKPKRKKAAPKGLAPSEPATDDIPPELAHAVPPADDL